MDLMHLCEHSWSSIAAIAGEQWVATVISIIVVVVVAAISTSEERVLCVASLLRARLRL
jgi:hypothetical protein